MECEVYMSLYWCLKLSHYLLLIAKDELYKNNYVVAEICLLNFTNIVDTLILDSGLIQDKEYKILKYSERLHWIEMIDPSLLNDWNIINSLFLKIFKENNNEIAKLMIEMVENRLKKMGIEKYVNSF